MTVGSWKVRVRLAAVLVVGAVSVTGCAASGGAAAVVEGEAIEISALHEATAELSPYLQDASPAAVLLLLVAAPTFERVAQENGVGVSEQEARAVLDQLAANAPDGEGAGDDGAPAEWGQASVSVARLTLLQQRLQDRPDGAAVLEDVSAELADLDVEVNPRYGEVDFAGGTGITPVEHAWIVPSDTP